MAARALSSVLGNGQRLDGGAMYGNAPRSLWSRWSPPDADNRIELACRCLVVREAGRCVLFEAGIGACLPPELRARYGVTGDGNQLLAGLAALGVREEDVGVVVLSHLHFDHAGGVLSDWREGKPLSLRFPKARFVVGRTAFERARRPHPRDRASFVPELPALLEASGRLELVEGERSATLGPDYRFHVSHGHTPGMLLAEVKGRDGPVVFVADLVPGVPWLRAALTMGYDRAPELLVDEKTALLDGLVTRGGRVFFTHDPSVALARVARDARAGFAAAETVGVLGWCEA